MATARTATPVPIPSKNEFRKLCIKVLKEHFPGVRITDEAMRLLRRDLSAGADLMTFLPETLRGMFAQMLEHPTRARQISRDDVTAYSTARSAGASGEEGQERPAMRMAVPPRRRVRRILEERVVNGVTQYLCEYEPSLVRIDEIPQAVLDQLHNSVGGDEEETETEGEEGNEEATGEEA